MRKQNGVFWFCLAGTVLLTWGVIFLPRYLSRSLDMRSIGQVEMSGRDGFSFLEAGSNDILGVVRAFQYLEKDGENPILITSIEEPAQIDREMLDHIYEEVTYASEFGMLPGLEIREKYKETYDALELVYTNWSEQVKYARYYSLTYESIENPNKKEMLNFWYLRFSDGVRFDYYFIVNAVTWQIYYAEIYNELTENIIADGTLYTRDANISQNSVIEGDMGISESIYYIDGVGITCSAACMAYYEALDWEYIKQTGQKTLNEKIGIIILYCREEEEMGNIKNVYIEINTRKESVIDGFRGISIGFQDLSGWAEYLDQ